MNRLVLILNIDLFFNSSSSEGPGRRERKFPSPEEPLLLENNNSKQ